ncbi:hypothetical protein [Cryobacterium aureum]|uniref:hypothetical protein n=1 Tax=Cryobacterium aureum TaxID=995037 RepID=UPI000CF41208|nr:hypothetical protein [Cryobacterium aureum]
MTVDRAARRVVASVSLSPFVSLLALAALLLAVFAFHSEASGHTMYTPAPAASAVAGQEVAVMGMAAVVAAPVVASIFSSSLDGMLDCALLMMTCVLLLTLVALIFLTRLPDVYRRLLDARFVILGAWRSIALPIHRPSLTLLSISRV